MAKRDEDLKTEIGLLPDLGDIPAETTTPDQPLPIRAPSTIVERPPIRAPSTIADDSRPPLRAPSTLHEIPAIDADEHDAPPMRLQIPEAVTQAEVPPAVAPLPIPALLRAPIAPPIPASERPHRPGPGLLFAVTANAPAPSGPPAKTPIEWTWDAVRWHALVLVLFGTLAYGVWQKANIPEVRRPPRSLSLAAAAKPVPRSWHDTIAVEMPAGPAIVTILSTPPGARVRIDGEDAGTTPLVKTSTPTRATLRVRMELAGFQAWEGEVARSPQGNFTANIPLSTDELDPGVRDVERARRAPR